MFKDNRLGMRTLRIVSAFVLSISMARMASGAHDVEKFSWSFPNFIGDPCVPGTGYFTWERYRETFIGIPSIPVLNNGFDYVYYKALHETLPDKGHCFGLALMSSLIVEKGGHLGFCGPVGQYSGDLVGILSQSGPVRHTCDCSPNLDCPQELGPDDPALRRAIEEMHGYQLNLTCTKHMFDLISTNKTASGDQAFLDVENELNKKKFPLVSIRDDIALNFGAAGHVILAYKTDVVGNEKRIYVYDPNRTWAIPGAGNRDWYLNNENYVKITNNNWEFDMVGADVWSGGQIDGGTIAIFPTSVAGPRDRNPASLGMSVSTLLLQIFVFGSDSSLVQIADGEGKKLFKPGTRKIETDPAKGMLNAAPQLRWDGLEANAAGGQSFLVFDNINGPLDLEIQSGAAGYEVYVAGRSSVVRVQAHSGRGKDLLRVSDVGTKEPKVILFNAIGAESYEVDVSLIVKPQENVRVFELKNLVMPQGGLLELKAAPGQKSLQATSPFQGAKFDLEITNQSKTGEEIVPLPDVEVDAGESAEIRPMSWLDLDAAPPIVTDQILSADSVEEYGQMIGGPTGGPIGLHFTATRNVGGALGGFTVYDSRAEVYTQVSSGKGIGAGGDGFQFGYQALSGDFEFTVEILERFDPRVGGSHAARHGLMARRDTSGRGRFSLLATSGGETREWPRWAHRSVHGESDAVSDDHEFNYEPDQWPRFMKMVRRGDTFYGFLSLDGETWRPVGSDTWHGLEPDAPVLAGFASTSHESAGNNPMTIRFKVLHLGSPEPALPPTLPADGAVSGREVLSSDFTGPDGSIPGGFSVQRGAGTFTPQVRSGRLRMIDEAAGGSATSAFSRNALPDIDSAVYRFEFDLHFSRSGEDLPADGLAFVMMGGRDASRVGSPGRGLGYEMLGRDPRTGANISGGSFAVEFDTWRNDGFVEGDGSPAVPRGYHVGIDGQNQISSQVLTSEDLPDPFAPAGIHVRILYNRGKVSVTLMPNGAGGGAEVNLEADVLPISFGAADESAVFGFTASTGGSTGGSTLTAEVDDLQVARLDCDDIQEVAAVLGVPAAPVPAGSTVILDGSGSHGGPGDEGEPVTYLWKVLAGGAAIVGPDHGPTVSLFLSSAGPVTVRLTADDGHCENPASTEISFVVEGGGGNWVRCDCSGDSLRDLSDPITLLQYLFLGGGEPRCLAACECSGDGGLDLSDAVYDLNFQFLGGTPPPAPYPACDLFPGCGQGCPR